MSPIPSDIPAPTVRRLSQYLSVLEHFCQPPCTISSKELAAQMKTSDAQVRKDFATFGAYGQPGVGYDVTDLIRRIRRTLGVDKPWNVVLVGVGNLGRALLSYGGFAQRSLHIVACFDADPHRIGTKVRDLLVQPMAELEATLRQHDVKLAILAVPRASAQEAADLLIRAGVRGILNFSSVTLHAPGIAVQPVDLSAGLEQLAFQINAAAASRENSARDGV